MFSELKKYFELKHDHDTYKVVFLAITFWVQDQNYYVVSITLFPSTHKITEQAGEKSIIDAINEEQLKKIQSLTKELEETDKLDVETSSSMNENSKKDKIAAEKEETKGDLKLGNQVLSAAGEHYLKTDDKDITSFQENDTVAAHSKVAFFNISP